MSPVIAVMEHVVAILSVELGSFSTPNEKREAMGRPDHLFETRRGGVVGSRGIDRRRSEQIRAAPQMYQDKACVHIIDAAVHLRAEHR